MKGRLIRAMRSGRRFEQPEAGQQRPEHALPGAIGVTEGAVGDQQDREGDRKRQQRQAAVSQVQHRDDEQHGDDRATMNLPPGHEE